MAWKTAFAMLGTASVALLFSAGIAHAQGSDPLVKRGQTLWQNRGCAGCHMIGKRNIAPDVAGVTARRGRDWVVRWLKDTRAMLETDSVAIAMLAEYNGAKMPGQRLSDQDVEALLAFISYVEAKVAK